MYSANSGLTVQELIDLLKDLKAKYGNVRVSSGGQDYPDGVRDAYYVESDPYKGTNTIYIG